MKPCMNYRALTAFLTFASVASAGDSFFSADGKTVTFAPAMRTGHLLRVDIESGKLTELPLPANLKTADVSGLARGGEGEALFIAEKAVWVMKDDGTVKKVCDTGPAENAENLFVSVKPGQPLKDWLFLSGTPKDETSFIFFARKPGQKTFGDVFCRRADDVRAGAFADDGRLFFSSHGDIWEGGFDPEEETGIRMATLVGARIAPVGMLNTDMTNSGSRYVGGLAPAGKWLYAALRGRHQGSIIRVPIPAKPLYNQDSEEQPETKPHLEAMRAALDKVELIVAETGGISAFCACEVEGKALVFYRGARDEKGLGLWLWNGSGEPKRLANEPDAE